MKKAIIVLVVSLLLVFSTFHTLMRINITNSSWAQELSEQDKHLRNLNLLRRIAGAEREAQITSTAEIHKASIYGLDETEIPQSLITGFDRIYAMIVHYLHLEEKGAKNVVWSMDFDSLQEMPSGKEACLGGCPVVLAALYDSVFNYCFFTPQYMDDYYVTHELLHYFIDQYKEEVAQALPEVITSQNRTGLPLRDFLKQNEEEIVINLAQIIIQESLAGFVLKESRCTCKPETMLDISGNVVCTCVKPTEQMISDKTVECKSCHGTEEIGKFVSQ